MTPEEDWGPHLELFNEAVAFAEHSLANDDAGFLTMKRRSTMVEVFGLLGEEINEARAEGRGVDPFIVTFYVQQIIDCVSFPEGDQPPIYFEDMPEAPDDPDLRVFSYQPRPPHRPRREKNEHDIAYVGGEVAGKFDLKIHATAERKAERRHRKPWAVRVVAEALRHVSEDSRGSESTVRKRLTAETKEYFEMVLRDGREERAASEVATSGKG